MSDAVKSGWDAGKACFARQTGQRSEQSPEASPVGNQAKHRDKQSGRDSRTMKVVHAEASELSAHMWHLNTHLRLLLCI